MIRIGAAILAAGGSRLFGRPKQLMPFRGTTLIRSIAYEVCASSVDHVAVVLGARANDISPELDELRTVVIPNPLWRDGVASSIRSAVLWAAINRCDALAIVLCDQARLTAAHLDSLYAAHRLTHRSVASYYGNTVGVPAVFDKIEYPKLLELEGDIGARRVLLAARPMAVEWPDGAYDVDTPNLVAAG